MDNTIIHTYIYVYRTNKKVEDYTVQLEELSEVKYFPITDIEKALDEKDSDYAFYDEPYIKEILNRIK